MKFRVPKECRGLVHGGDVLAVAADRSLEAPEDSAPLLLAHGVTPWREERRAAVPQLGPRDIEAMPRGALIAALAQRGQVPASASTSELRRALRQAVAAQRS